MKQKSETVVVPTQEMVPLFRFRQCFGTSEKLCTLTHLHIIFFKNENIVFVKTLYFFLCIVVLYQLYISYVNLQWVAHLAVRYHNSQKLHNCIRTKMGKLQTTFYCCLQLILFCYVSDILCFCSKCSHRMNPADERCPTSFQIQKPYCK